MKKIILFLLTLVLILPMNAFASDMSGIYYPPSPTKYFMKKITIGVYSSPGVSNVKLILYESNKTYGTKIFKVKGNSTTWLDISCSGNVAVQFLDRNGKITDSFGIADTDLYINNKSCKYKTFANVSNFDPKKGKYKK